MDDLLDILRGGSSIGQALSDLRDGKFEAVLTQDFAQELFGVSREGDIQDNTISWTDYISRQVDNFLRSNSRDLESRCHRLLVVGLAACHAFIQSNVTGPPLDFSSSKTVIPASYASEEASLKDVRRLAIASLGVDGEAAYSLTPNVELFCIAKIILNHPLIEENVFGARWAKVRVNFWHQRMLSEVTATLQTAIYRDIDRLNEEVLAADSLYSDEAKARYLIERAVINTHHSLDVKAREDLDRVSSLRGFEFALTGLMGKRTKFQQKDVSQLVVLARSAEEGKKATESSDTAPAEEASKPATLDLNDDTLLENISFTQKPTSSSTNIREESALPESLASLDPSNQPALNPLDSIILLSLASSITNTSPLHGLTREETLPYATRVLDGGSTNWQVYTQALLVRSRIEGYKSRTVERGVLQLQALVDQVIADTTPDTGASTALGESSTATTFLPRPKESESAPVSERLKYIHQVCSPTRWELEAELASRWVSLGGLRTALEIYERLHMWAEAALCWAAVEREDKAKRMIRKQLFHPTAGPDAVVADDDEESWEGPEREPPPGDAPRLYCILGDIENDPKMWECAWEVSKNRYARAQRSLGRYYFTAKDFPRAEAAYASSLKVNPLNHPTWFALGCVRLTLEQWDAAVQAFARTVQLDDTDAEAWSNLGAALLHLEAASPTDNGFGQGNSNAEAQLSHDDAEDVALYKQQSKIDPQQNRKQARKALARAASLKYDNFRIWENLLIVAASIKPPVYSDVVAAQKRLIELRGPTVGEACVDEDIIDMLIRHVIASTEVEPAPGQSVKDALDIAVRRGLPRLVIELVEKHVVPLITSSRRLWDLVAKLALWRKRPATALDAHEKAWRTVVQQPGWEFGTEAQWNIVVDATIELTEAYESLGPMPKTEGLAAGGGDGEDAPPVAKDWKFKARSAIRGIMGRGKSTWEDTPGWERLTNAMADFRGA
ncbi:protein prenylyltransferase [Xylona heveae TC161]|uniref:Protein prenylyltransferase n=1 Tax=Xylona heveae (strain CBS 132557 / TC161) TaxID=1328760 RepID=A0A165HD45_XYLHT|nr:protein prenylyltransferase [Xylona heveae TC161]KZF23329.1 protein prenylyltransferase [Xylona heveae TC161]